MKTTRSILFAMRNNIELKKLQNECNKYFDLALSSENQNETCFYLGWLSAICLVYQKHDKKYFNNLQIRISELLKERGLA